MNEEKIMEGEILPPAMKSDTAEMVSTGMSLIRLENSTQMMVAVQRPRDEGKILDACLRELILYRSLAEEALYSKPVGKDDHGKMKYAEGLSIRSAESLANRWGNNAYGCEITADDDDSATLSAVYLDYETNTRTVLQRRVSKYYKKKVGGIVKYTPDRFDVILAANQSKLLREAILRRLPAGLKKEYEIKVKEILAQKPIPERQKKMVAAFMALGIKSEQLEQLRNKKVADFDHEDLTELLGSFNAIKDGETTIDELTEKKTPPPIDYELPEEVLLMLNQYFDALDMNEAQRSMKLAACKGNIEAAEKLKEELITEIQKGKDAGLFEKGKKK